MDSNIKKKSIHKVAHAKKSKAKQNTKSSSQLVSRGLRTNAIAERSPEPCQTLSTVVSTAPCPTPAKLPPDFLGTAAYLSLADKMALGPELLEAAGLGAVGFQEQIQCKDGLERLAISQVLVTHARVMWLSKLLTEQTNTKAIATISAAIDSGLSAFSRLLRALDERRRPLTGNTTFSIQQANVAANQAIQNIENKEIATKHGNQTKIGPEQASIDAEIVSAHAKRIAVTPKNHQTNKTVDKKHRTKNSRRKGQGGTERV
jgi:hypothetical protein